MGKDPVRVAAVGDLHCARTSQGAFQPLFAQIGEAADLLLLTGDLTDHGLPEEARVLALELATLRIPTVAVLGNHDYESNQQLEVRNILTGAGVTVLDGEACEVLKIGIAGVKGFAGGFGKRALGPWGEAMIKQFVHEAVNEALKLEAALARLRTPQIIALMHYSPIQQTVEGEPLEIYAFVGSKPAGGAAQSLSRDAGVSRARASRAAARHDGEQRSRLQRVDASPLTRMFPDKPPFRLMTLLVDTPGVA